VPDEDSIADEHPSTDQLSQVLDGSHIYVEEIQTERIENVIREEIIELTEDIAIEEVDQLDQIGKELQIIFQNYDFFFEIFYFLKNF